jgi:peptide/nickel transport system substrate-binding protein
MKTGYYSRLVWAFVLRFKGILIISVFLGLLLFIASRFIFPYFWGQTERVGIIGRYSANEIPREILAKVGMGLTQIDASGKVQPALAISWEASDGGKIWTFHLKEGALWQDGKQVTADSINYTFEDVQIETPNASTIVFKLKSPFAPFPSILAKPIFKKGFLGTGEWRVTKISLAGSYVQKLTLKDQDNNRQIIKFYPTEERTKLAFELGEVDTISDLIDPKPFDQWRKVVEIKKEVTTDRFVAVFFNTGGESPLAQKDLRQALSYAINKESFAGERALGPIPPTSWAYNPQVKPYDYSPERARELIEDLPDEVKSSLNINLVTTPALLSVAEQIAKDWQAVGIKTTVQVTSVLPSEYQAFLAIYDVPDDPDQYSTWHSTQEATNIAHYGNPRIDKLLEDGRTELNEDKRRGIYLDFQRFLLEDAPAAFLYHPASYTVRRK